MYDAVAGSKSLSNDALPLRRSSWDLGVPAGGMFPERQRMASRLTIPISLRFRLFRAGRPGLRAVQGLQDSPGLFRILQPRMHPRVADLAQGEKIAGVVIGLVLVYVVYVQRGRPAAYSATGSVTLQDRFSNFLPLLEGVFIPGSNGKARQRADQRPVLPDCIRTAVAEMFESVHLDPSAAEGIAAGIECIQRELDLDRAILAARCPPTPGGSTPVCVQAS